MWFGDVPIRPKRKRRDELQAEGTILDKIKRKGGLFRKKEPDKAIPTTANAVLNKPDDEQEHGGINVSCGFGCHGCGGCGCGGDCGGGCGPCH